MLSIILLLLFPPSSPKEIEVLISKEYQSSNLSMRTTTSWEFIAKAESYSDSIVYYYDALYRGIKTDSVICGVLLISIRKCGLTKDSFVNHGNAAYWEIFSIKDSILAITHSDKQGKEHYVSLKSIQDRDSLFTSLVKKDIEELGCEFRKEEEPEEQE